MKDVPLSRSIKTLDDLERFLAQPYCEAMHLYCDFQKEHLQRKHLVALKHHKIKSIHFEYVDVIYPDHRLTQFKQEQG